jgi:nicotinamidase/pyrazinamidase
MATQAALLLVDLQNDFFPGGALPTPEGDQVVGPVNQLIERFQCRLLPMVATRDWHPENHCSFKKQGGRWPPHCIRHTVGAAFHPDVHLPATAIVVSKATAPEVEAYSGFEGTDLALRLRLMKVGSLVIGGLATDYCVKHTVLDALKAAFNVTLVREAIRGVEAETGDSARAIAEMQAQGACIVSLDELTV